MKQLQKSDLKEGEIYTEPNNGNICMWNKTDSKYFIGNRKSNFKKGEGGFGAINNYRLREATPEEKHWLETCIKEDKFVSYEESMKTFIPEYVKCTLQQIGSDYKLGEIYKVSSTSQNVNKIESHNNQGMAFYQMNKHRFKPSTKEAYDAQFVVKEPEFVLPKLWCIKLTIENQETVIDYINQNTKDGERKGLIDVYYGYNGEHCTCIFNKLSNTEITFDQFQKYVLKEEKETVTIKTTVETKSKFINNNTVETSEGSIFKVGDLVTPFENSSPNKGKKFKITGFRWNNSQTEICAITNLHKPYGIGVEKLEIYLELKVKAEIVEDFVLPEKWCVEVNDKICNKFSYYEAYGYHHSIKVNQNNKWSKNIKEGFTEITFEQFKKYVLKDE